MPKNQPSHVTFFELQHEICSKRISGVFLTSHDRDLEIVKDGVSNLMQKHFDRRTDNGVRSCDTRSRRFLGSVTQDVVDVLVANSDGVVAIPCVRYSVDPSRFN